MSGVKIRRGSVFLDLGLVRAIRPLWIAWLLLIPPIAQAQFTFTTNNGAITITGYTGPGGNVTIPDTTNGWPVTTIGAYAFSNQTTLTSVTIPNSVTNIGSYAFSDCTNLHQVYFQGNAPSVNGGAGSADSTVFQGESGTAYYMPDTTGWDATFGGWPTHVTQTVHEAGFIKDERWDGYVVSNIVNNTVPATPSYQMAVPEWGITQDNSAAHGNFVRRVSGYFVPPVTQHYNFFITSDDDSLLFLSTDDTPGNKVQIASQIYWNGGSRWDWVDVRNTSDNAGWSLQTHSDTYASDGLHGTNIPNSHGILLNGGQRYYIEQDMHQGGGGANMAATWTTFGDPNPAIGTETAFKGSAIEMTVPRCSYVAYIQQPANVANAKLGSKVAFSVAGTTDSQVTIGGINGYEENYTNNFLFFQWFTNGVPVPGANGPNYLYPVTADCVGMQIMCQTRALGFTDDALNPIWTNSTSATVTSVVAARPPEMIGRWFSGAATLADSVNIDGPGHFDAMAVRATTSTRFYYFTNDVPYGAPAGAQALWLVNQGMVITNTDTFDDNGYTDDTFDGQLQNGMTVMFWAKGFPGAWNPWVSKYGENGLGWQLRINNGGPNSCWTMRGTGGNDDMTSSFGTGDGLWHHYAGTWNGTNFTRNLYVDGQLAATTTGTSLYALAPASALMIGARDAGNNSYNNFFTGGIYDVRIYNYALNNIVVGPPLPPPFPPGPPIIFTNGQIVVTWSGGGSLQSSTNVAGPFAAVPGATSPYTNILDSAVPNMFFRLSLP